MANQKVKSDVAIEPRDVAFEKFKLLGKQLIIPAFLESLKTEADIRMKIIDPVFRDVLGWPDSSMFLQKKGDAADAAN